MDGKGACATTWSSSGYGAASNTRRSTCGPTTTSARPAPRSADISTSTIAADRTKALTTPHPTRSSRMTVPQVLFNGEFVSGDRQCDISHRRLLGISRNEKHLEIRSHGPAKIRKLPPVHPAGQSHIGDAPVIGKRCAGIVRHSDRRPHSAAANPGRLASPLRPGLGF